jgi:hypothetical protein
MQFQLHLPEECSWVEVIVTAPITAEHETGFIKETIEMADATNRADMLVDVSQVPNQATELDKFDMADYAIEQLGLGRQARIAVLAAPDDPSHDFIEAIMRNAGFKCQLFRDRAEACLWLRNES